MTFFLLLNIGSIFHQIHYYRVILLSIIGNIREKLINDSFRYESKKKKRNVRKNMKIRHDVVLKYVHGHGLLYRLLLNLVDRPAR